MAKARRDMRLCGLIALAMGVSAALAEPLPEAEPAPASTPDPAPAPAAEKPTGPEEPAAQNPIREREVVVREPRVGDSVAIDFADGRTIEGAVEKINPGLYELRIAGALVRVEVGRDDRVRVLESVHDRYKAVRATIEDDDIEKLLALVSWLEKQRLYEEALVEVEGVLRREPNQPDALRARRTLVPLIELQNRQREDAGKEPRRSERPEVARRPALDEFPLLTPEQVRLMKVFEVDLKNPPKLVIRRETVEKLLSQYSENPLIPTTREGREAFFRLPPERILDVMFRVQARDLYGEVEVVGNPRSMEFFRDRVHATWIMNTMSTTRCHGGSASGRLRLFNRRPTAEQTFYTNYLILDRFETREGRKLIDYSEPENSLLLQMALPRNDSPNPHPEVEGWQPAFKDRSSRRYRQALEWIQMMYRPRPEYPIEYSPPGEAGDRPAALPPPAGTEDGPPVPR